MDPVVTCFVSKLKGQVHGLYTNTIDVCPVSQRVLTDDVTKRTTIQSCTLLRTRAYITGCTRYPLPTSTSTT